MSGGLDDARRQERQIEDIERALDHLDGELGEVYDEVFGLPTWALETINATLENFGVTVVPMKGEEK
jgi:hypothetical protein